MRPVYWCFSDTDSNANYDFVIQGMGEYRIDGSWVLKGDVIWIPVRNHVLSQLSLSSLAPEVRNLLEVDETSAKLRLDELAKQKRRYENQLNNLKHNLLEAQFSEEDALKFKDEFEDLTGKIRALEIEKNQSMPSVNIEKEEYQFIVDFLSDMKDDWDKIPLNLQGRLFRLLLDAVVISMQEDDNFLVNIHWNCGKVDTLWIERPFGNRSRVPWTDEEIALLEKNYPTESWFKLLELFPGKVRDAIALKASRMRIKRVNRQQIPWGEKHEQVLTEFCDGLISYKTMRYELAHIRIDTIKRRVEKLGLEWPDTDKINWKVILQPDTEVDEPILCSILNSQTLSELVDISVAFSNQNANHLSV